MSSKLELLCGILLYSVLTLYISHILPKTFVIAQDRQAAAEALTKLKRPWKSPYLKFGFTAPMFNVCTLRYYQKRELCSTLLALDRFDLQLVTENSPEYQDLSCRNMYVDFSPILKGSRYEKVAVSAYKCPRAYKVDIIARGEHIDHKKIFIPIVFYISGSIYPNSAILHYQHHSPLRSKVKAYLVAFELPVISLSFMVVHRRNMAWERSVEDTRIFQEKNVRRKIGKNDFVIRAPWEAESALAKFEEIKRLPLMDKFNKTLYLKNICGLKRQEKVQRCIRAFQNIVYATLINQSGRFICRRRKAVYNFSFPLFSKLTPPMVSMLHCPTWKWTTAYSFHLSTHLKATSSISFLKINPFPELLPDAVVGDNTQEQKGSDSGFGSDENYLQRIDLV